MFAKLNKLRSDHEKALERYPSDRDVIEGIYDLILETVLSIQDTIWIAKNEYPKNLVKSKFLKLNSMHLQYVLDCMKDNVENKKHLERYLPEENYLHTNVSCKHVLLFNKKAKMYMNLETIRIMKNENGNVITERIHDEFVMDVEKKDGVWSVKKV